MYDEATKHLPDRQRVDLMRRRRLLACGGACVTAVVGGCLEDSGEAGSREPLEVRLYNYTDDPVTVDLLVEADGGTIVDETFELEAPETVFTQTIAGTIPEGTERARVEATATADGRQYEQDRTFEFPWEEPIEGLELRVDDDRLSIGVLAYEEPA